MSSTGHQEDGGSSGAKGANKKGDGNASNPFTRYYAQLLHQQNMLQDSVRTGA